MIEANKRIALNTVVVYTRLSIMMVVGLVSSRFVLKALGASDYGLYGVVAGLLSLLTMISGAMSGTTVRFMNYESGKKDGDPVMVFNICAVLHIITAIIIFVVAEIIGVWYINNYLNVLPEKIPDAHFVFQVSTIIACLGIVNTPFSSLFIVNEKFLEVAVIDIISAVINLGLVISLSFCHGNVLRYYSIFVSSTALLSILSYQILCRRNWPEFMKLKWINNRQKYKEVLFFNNWNMLSSASILSRSQGSNLLINYFFGTLVNAAFSIGNTVMNYVNMFVGNFDSASNPQITQSIGSGDMERALFLVKKTCKICVLLMELVFFPLFAETEFVLGLWLGFDNVPAGASTFCRLTLLEAVISATSCGLGRFIYGMGKIKWFKIEFSVFFLLCIPLGYLAYRMGMQPYFIIVLFIIADILTRIVELILLKRMFNFNVLSFVKESYYRPFIIFLIMTILVYVYQSLSISLWQHHLLGLFAITIITGSLIVMLGLDKKEMQLMKSSFNRVLKRIKN